MQSFNQWLESKEREAAQQKQIAKGNSPEQIDAKYGDPRFYYDGDDPLEKMRKDIARAAAKKKKAVK